MFVGLSLQLSSSLATATPLNTEIESLSNNSPNQLVFIDSTIQNYQDLIADIQANPSVNNIRIVKLDSPKSPILQITQTLKKYSNLDALHLFTHGFSGGLKLGDKMLQQSTIQSHQDQFYQWGKSLSSQGDILLYGCDVAKGKLGNAFINALAKITQADVSASNNISGNPAKDQDWILEKNTGKIEAATLIANINSNKFQASLDISQGNAFLYGDNIEVGISPDGAFGSRVVSPAGKFQGRILGYISDPSEDGFQHSYHGDFFIHGYPEEGWAITVNGTNYNNNRNIQYTAASKTVPGSLGNFQTTTTTRKVTWEGSIEGLNITQNFRIYASGLSVIIDVELENTTTETMHDVYYMRTVDPDNNFKTNNSTVTKNTIIRQGGDGGGAIVIAEQDDGSILGLSGEGANSRVTYGNIIFQEQVISYRNPLSVYEGTDHLKNSGSHTGDESIGIAFKFDHIYPAQTVKFRLGYQLADIVPAIIDLDSDNSSTALGNTFHQVYKLGSSASKITDSDLSISQLSSDIINGASIQITNAHPNDKIETIGNLPAGISVNQDESNNDTEIHLTGSASKNAYISALKQIAFSNAVATSMTNTRTISLQILDINYTESSAAESKIEIITPITLSNNNIAGDNLVNGTEVNSIVIAGTAAPNIPIEVIFTDKDNNKVTKSIVSDDNGNWSLSEDPANLSDLTDGSIKVDIISTDTDTKNKSFFTKNIEKDATIVLDITPDSSQTITNPNPTFSGKTDPNASITFKLSPSGKEFTIQADDSGNWSYTLTDLPLGATISVEIIAEDTAGNKKTETRTVTTPIIPLEVTDLDTDDNGLASSTTPTFSGTSTPNTSITITIPTDGNNTESCTTTTDADGNWSCTMPELPTGGPYQATIKTEDSRGNEASTSQSLSIPEVPLIISSPTDNAVISGTTPSISGTSTPGTTITVTSSTGQKCTSITDATNHWSCELPTLPLDESFTLTITTEDGVGNTTTKVINISTDKLPLSILSPGDKGTAGDSTPSFIGTSTPGTKITVTASTGVKCETIVDAEGNWVCKLPPLPVGGPYTIIIKAEDSNGNITTIEESINIPKVPLIIISPIEGETYTGSSMILTGTSDANTKITILGADGEVCTTVSDATGKWSCELHNLQDGTSKHFTIISGSKAEGEKITILTLDIENSSEKVSTIVNGGAGSSSLLILLLMGLGLGLKRNYFRRQL